MGRGVEALIHLSPRDFPLPQSQYAPEPQKSAPIGCPFVISESRLSHEAMIIEWPLLLNGGNLERITQET